MTANELQIRLNSFSPDKEIIIFDEKAIPYRIKTVIADLNDGTFSHIEIEPIEE